MTTPNRSRRGQARGVFIAVFGPDGAGKSAVIDALPSRLEAHFSGTTRFHFRPMFRPHGVERPPVLDPHSQPPRGLLLSMCKLFYWWIDYWFGYLTVIRPAMAQSRLVVFDRYFHDILVDPRRYRLPASSLWLARLLVQFAPQLDLFILLDAPAEVLQNRKREVSPAESARQRAAYLRMFASLPNTLIVDASPPVERVAEQISAVLLTFFSAPSSLSTEVIPSAIF